MRDDELAIEWRSACSLLKQGRARLRLRLVEDLDGGPARWRRLEGGARAPAVHLVELGKTAVRQVAPSSRKVFVFALCCHELAHVIQWEAWGDGVFALDDINAEVIRSRFLPGTLRESALQMRPLEADANALATRALSVRYPDSLQQLRGTPIEHILAFSGGVDALSTLPRRIIASLAASAAGSDADSVLELLRETAYRDFGELGEWVEETRKLFAFSP